ncbi:ATP-binding cassette subfamily B protein [Methylopila capsulata]|uniref:ABC transporter ATP-binding protein n=1 Tax=Methylopila capsulata TaxID=61654 RepID=A0A9W6ITI4_9HYPH|nr:ABC transporter ATP-binding protein [Methylopila capsulata]MBM7849800.1 ATP-binding cassette subfamily B protein [Methylopila capsulata]GLK55089.1 ABC transporter ATP-binding protein [Methylopila capsulata]
MSEASTSFRPDTQEERSAIAASLQSPSAFFWRYAKRWPGHFIALGLVVTVGACMMVATQYGMKLLVDAMAAPPPASPALWWALAFFVATTALEGALWRVSGWLGCRTTVGVGVDIRLDLLDHVAGHPMRYFQDQRAGALGHRITSTAGDFGVLTNNMTWNVMPPIVSFLGAVVIFFTINLGMAIALSAFAVIVTIGLVLFGRRGRPLHRHYAEQAGLVGGELIDVLTNIWSVKAFAASARERRRLRHIFDGEATAQRRSWMFTEKARVMHDVLLWAMAGSMMLWAVSLWSRGSVTTGDVVVVSTLVFRILHGSRDLAMALVDMERHVSYIAETLKVIGTPHEVVDLEDARPFQKRGGSIAFEKVSFGYGGSHAVLRDFDFTVPAGQKVGIVGPSGAGKSTLIHLVQRLHDVEAGRVLIDGQSAAEITQESLRYAIAVVPQEISLFHRSVMENIRFARPEATDDEVREAAAAAHCGFIDDLDDGFDTLVGERGAKLSGGQRQRIGIARAILKNAPIVVLDEATSALDTESEIEVQTALTRLTRDRTVLAVAHRLSTLADFDRIVVLVEGRVVEEGPIGDLLAANGVFARMWRLQSRGLSVDEALDKAG